MIFLYFLEYVFLALFLLAMGTQVIWPIISGQKTWPIFRHRKVEAKIADLDEQLRQLELAEVAKRKGQELHKRREGDNQGDSK